MEVLMLGGYRRAWWSALLVLLVAVAVAAGCGSSGSNNTSGSDAGMGDDATGMPDGHIGFGGDAASSLTISPQNPVLNVNKAGVTLQFKALENGVAVPATWTIDVADIGTIDSTGL